MCSAAAVVNILLSGVDFLCSKSQITLYGYILQYASLLYKDLKKIRFIPHIYIPNKINPNLSMPYNIQAAFPFPSCPKMPCYSSKPALSSQVRGTCRTLLGTCLLHPPALSHPFCPCHLSGRMPSLGTDCMASGFLPP